jgi:hypothetical protein
MKGKNIMPNYNDPKSQTPNIFKLRDIDKIVSEFPFGKGSSGEFLSFMDIYNDYLKHKSGDELNKEPEKKPEEKKEEKKPMDKYPFKTEKHEQLPQFVYYALIMYKESMNQQMVKMEHEYQTKINNLKEWQEKNVMDPKSDVVNLKECVEIACAKFEKDLEARKTEMNTVMINIEMFLKEHF